MALDLKKRMLTVQELAEYMSVTPVTIYRLAESGTLPAKHIGDSIRFLPDDVEKFLASAKYTKSKRGRKSRKAKGGSKSSTKTRPTK